MVKYSKEPDNPTKSCKARGSDLRVHFKGLVAIIEQGSRKLQGDYSHYYWVNLWIFAANLSLRLNWQQASPRSPKLLLE
ncbi:hypothetical protein J1N35_042378 [Gossypium stocksii]|uniref:Uncharacterized protein n=1 Tax=Gossypium stocksii TaxID=47602 RepID=A0A9D3UH94_9ROSI|nr:hypothetical protein J1N35_042378 [Gossypium stocksii]